MLSEVTGFDTFNIPRVAQLSQRSNQFNLRTVRYTEEDTKRIANSNDTFSFSFTLSDKFGNYGLICVIIMKKIDYQDLFIDTWIMSCRVLKRGMENFTLNYLIKEAREKGFSRIIGEYIPTSKNGLVKDHFKSLGFKPLDQKWVIETAGYQIKECFINVK
jgi:FkbH-like protein